MCPVRSNQAARPNLYFGIGLGTMAIKEQLAEKALELGFVDVGFTTADPFSGYIEEVRSRPEEHYGRWITERFNLVDGARVQERHPWGKSIIVLLKNYHRRRVPPRLAGIIGRGYLVDERVTKRQEYGWLMEFFGLLKAEGIRFHFDNSLPARRAAVRSGLINFGKNCIGYSNRVARGASWLEIIPLVLDVEIEPDQPSMEIGCPKWCANACMIACPTRALYSPAKLNPLRCIAYNTYYGDTITPIEMREPMGTWIYGCDRCQEVCPRNTPWTQQDLPPNPDLESKVEDLLPQTLLNMSQEHYVEKVWPQAFYISRKYKAKWQMNAARALGNQGDLDNVPLLIQSFSDSPHEMVRGMCAWSLGQLGGARARAALEGRMLRENGLVRFEIEKALEIT